ncbi:nucleotide exchange factor SIL1-like isoform X1 [Ciona intestinalis]
MNVYYFIVFLLFEVGSSNKNEGILGVDDETMAFVPTHEWQEVKEGQAIPPGLHVKMDMSGGGRWAKLMDEGGGGKNMQVMAVGQEGGKKEESPQMDGHSVAELKQALKKIKAETTLDGKEEDVKTKFKSMDEIKEVLGQYEMRQESDVDVMKRLLGVLRTSEEESAIILALQDLEYYVHQIDNANDLVTIGGFPVVISLFNHTRAEVREEAIHLVGSAAQSNPPVQIKIIELGVLPKLLRVLADEGESPAVRKKSLFAISSIVRHFPLAQQKLGEFGGLQVLMGLFQQEKTMSYRMKAIRLVNDLIVERLTTNQGTDKMKQYDKLPLFTKLQELDWCHLVVDSLNSDSHENREISMNAMNNLRPACPGGFDSKPAIEKLRQLKVEYKSLWDTEVADGDNDGYFKLLYNLVGDVKDNWLNWQQKDEL